MHKQRLSLSHANAKWMVYSARFRPFQGIRMDASEVRRNRLQAWVDEQFEGRVSAFCRYYGLADSMASYLSQLLGGHRNFGERAARKLEDHCKRPAGWLDVSPDVKEELPLLRYDKHLIAQLSVRDRELIEDFIALVVKRHESAASGSTRFSQSSIASPPSAAVKEAARKPVKSPLHKDEHAPPRKRHKHR